MSEKLHTFITNALAMPYYGNDNAGSGTKFNSHEDALIVELVKAGFAESTLGKSSFPKLKKSTLHKAMKSSDPQQQISLLVPGFLPGHFLSQPCGSQNFPDFLVCDFSGKFVIIEAKSCNTTITPSWNGGLPKKDSIYIFSTGKYNKTTVFLGQDVITQEQSDALEKVDKILKKLSKDDMTEIKTLDVYNRGFDHYVRSKYYQSGGFDKVDYFKHKDRETCEQNVLKFALEQ
jgi:hypothetical protein